MVKSYKKVVSCFFLIIASTFFSGCQTVVLHALGSQPIPVMHEPRTDKSTSSETVISANLSGSILDSSLNKKDVSLIGGYFDATYRFGNIFSWLFVNGSFTGFYGVLKLTCTDSDCNDDFKKKVEENKTYSSASIQERVRAGVEFNPLFLNFGASAGFHFYQDFLEYEDVRNDLIDKDIVIGNPSYDIFPELRLWLGFRLGSQGKYGTVNIESSTQLFTDDTENLFSMNLGYFHPTGWHGGVFVQNGPIIYTVGKSFKF